MSEFCMPSLGADMDAGTLVEWKVKPGDPVKKGDVIAEVETDKGIIDIEVFEDGVVEQILIQPWQKAPVGTVLALIRAVGAPEAVADVVLFLCSDAARFITGQAINVDGGENMV